MQEERKVCSLIGDGIDLNKLRLNEEIEFEVGSDAFAEEFNKQYFDNEEALKQINFECTISGEGPEDDDKTPFERLAKNMEDISPSNDGGVLKKVLKAGTGNIVPVGAVARVHYNGYLEFSEEPFDSSRLRGKQMQFILGAGEGIQGWEIALSTMKRGEVSRFLIAPKYAYGKMGCPPRIPPDSTVMFEIEVISIVDRRAADEYENLSKEEKESTKFGKLLDVADSLREIGNEAFKNNQMMQALRSYKKAIRNLENCRLANEEEEKSMLNISLKLYLNSCLCCLKLKEYGKAAMYAKRALQIDRRHMKAHFRLGRAYLMMGEFADARGSLLQAQRLSPGNKEVRDELQKLEDDFKKFNAINKTMCEKMLESRTTQAVTKQDKVPDKTPSDNEVSSGLMEYVITKLREFKQNSSEVEFPLPICLKRQEVDQICSVANDLDLSIVEDEKENLMVVKKS